MKPNAATSSDREPIYASERVVARLVVELLESPYGVSLARFQEPPFKASERTLYRYAKLLREDVFIEKRWPPVMISSTPAGKVVKFKTLAGAKASTTRQLLSLYMAQAALVGLEGTVLKEDVGKLWKHLFDPLPQEERARLKDIPRKIFVVPYGIKKYALYAKLEGLVNKLVLAVMNQHSIQIESRGKHGEGTGDEFDPYSIVMNRGGLYLLCYSHLRRKIIQLAVEDIRSVTRVDGEDGSPTRFQYPRTYSPEKHLVDPDLVDFIVEDYAKHRRVRPTLFAWSAKEFFLIRYLDQDRQFLSALRTIFAQKGVTKCCVAMPGSIGEPTKDRQTFLLISIRRGVRYPELHMARVLPAESGRSATVQIFESDEMASGDFCGFLLDRKPSRTDVAKAMNVINDRRSRRERFIVQGL